MRKRRSFESREEVQNYWPSFTDMISTVALILFFLILLIFIKNIVVGKNLEITESKLLSTKENLIDKEEKLKQMNVEITEKETNLMMLEEEVDKMQAEVEDGQLELQLSNKKIQKQKKIIAKSNEELGDMRARLQEIAVLRVDILNKVKDAIEDELNEVDSGISNVRIGDNGSIMLSNKLLFDPDSYKIKEEGKELLDNLSIVFEKVLKDDDIRANIDYINIEGHTDDIDTGEYNRELSGNRSKSVVNYLLKSNPDLESKYGQYFVSSAYSEYRPVAQGTSKEARSQNRRIEISIVLKDSNVQKIIDEYLEDSLEVFED